MSIHPTHRVKLSILRPGGWSSTLYDYLCLVSAMYIYIDVDVY